MRWFIGIYRQYASIERHCGSKHFPLKIQRPQRGRFRASARQRTTLCRRKARIITTQTRGKFLYAACCTWSNEGTYFCMRVTPKKHLPRRAFFLPEINSLLFFFIVEIFCRIGACVPQVRALDSQKFSLKNSLSGAKTRK